MTPKELAAGGWSSVWLEYNAFTESYFEDDGLDVDSIQAFLEAEVDEYRLVELGGDSDFDYALHKKEPIEDDEH